MTLGVEATSKDVLDYWHSLQEDYRSSTGDEEERICFGTSCYGLQDDSNYWFLGPQVNKPIRVQNYLTKVIEIAHNVYMPLTQMIIHLLSGMHFSVFMKLVAEVTCNEIPNTRFCFVLLER